MSEKLTKFDWDEFVKDPSRLRSKDGTKAVRAAPLWGEVVLANWERGGSHISYYHPHDYQWLRLVAKTRTVMVRLYRDSAGYIFAKTNSGDGIDGVFGSKTDFGSQWVSSIVEIEVTE